MKILLIDDHGVVRAGTQRLLAMHFEAQILEAATAEPAIALYMSERPDAVILDLNLEGAGGLEILRRLLAFDASARVIIFSMHHETVYAVKALGAGARGYVTKSAAIDELVEAVRVVTNGGQYVDRELAARIAASPERGGNPLSGLSTRELEILRLLGEGKSMTSISGTLGIAYKTVANICTQMKVKLGVARTADLIRLALEARNG